MFWVLVVQSKPCWCHWSNQVADIQGPVRLTALIISDPCDSLALLALEIMLQYYVSCLQVPLRDSDVLCHGNRTFVCLRQTMSIQRKASLENEIFSPVPSFPLPRGVVQHSPCPELPFLCCAVSWGVGTCRSQLLGWGQQQKWLLSWAARAEPRGAGGEEPACVANGCSWLTSGPLRGCLQASTA